MPSKKETLPEPSSVWRNTPSFSNIGIMPRMATRSGIYWQSSVMRAS